MTDPGNTVALTGAIVKVDGLAGSSISDDAGRFRLANIPAGEHTLVISYVGTEDTRIAISVPEAGLAMGEVVLGGGTEVEEVIVFGQSAAAASGLSQERSADNLISALDTDAMGQFPDQNVAESLRRLSGVTVENDQGEGRYVVIRGMDPDLNSTSINGVQATSGEPRRALQLDVVPSDVLDGLEVSKTLTPDMNGNAIGGAINIKTLSAFSRKGAYMKAKLEGQYNELRDEWGPRASLAGSNIFELSSGRRFGVAGAVSYNDRKLLVNNNEADDWEVSDNGNDFSEEYQGRLYTVDRERISGVLNFDLEVSDSTVLHLYTLYSEFTDTELRNRTTWTLEDLDEDTVTATSADYSTVEVERDTKDRDQSAKNMSLSFGSDTQLTNWNISTNLGYSWAQETTPNQVEALWAAEFESDDGIIAAGDSVLTLDRTNPNVPVILSSYYDALTDPTLFELDEIEALDETNEDEAITFKIDAERDTGWGAYKVGVQGIWREKQTDETVDFWSNDDTWFMSDVPDPTGGLAYGFPTPVAPVPNAQDTRGILASGVGLEYEPLDSQINSNVADFVYNEDILAAYLMGRWETDRMTIIAGVRVEDTKTENAGNIVDIYEEGSIVDGVVLDEDTVIVTPVEASESYTDVLPSINLRFDFNENLVGRASIYKSVVRPRVEDVAFRVEIEDNEGELGNPLLDPFRAWNADMSLAYYPTELSVLSVGLFYKQIEKYIFVQELDDFEFLDRTLDSAVIAQNGEDATAVGIEFNYQQHFGFLGAPWDGFLLGINYTYVDSEADTGERTTELIKQSRNVGNFVFGYDKHGLNLRIAANYRSKYIDELVDVGYDRYTNDHMQWDFTGRYQITDRWQIYMEVVNINDEPEHYYAGNTSRMLQFDEIGRMATLGVQFNLQ